MEIVRLTLADGFLELHAAGTPLRRQWNPQDRDTLLGLSAQYATVAQDRAAELPRIALGRALGTWLWGESPLWKQALDAARAPLRLEIAASLRPTPEDRALLEAPWELLADDDGFWALDGRRRYAPARRLGSAVERTPAGALRLLFMAAAPEGQNFLDYEAEEMAILEAVAGRSDAARAPTIDLAVEDTGTAQELGERLVALHAEGRVHVVHLTCHGRSAPTPMLALESETGEVEHVGVDALADALGDRREAIDLLVLSACETGRATGAAQAMALELVARGVPAALGWAAKVSDGDATRFGAALYRGLARGDGLATAVADARRVTAEDVRSDWHLARLWLGSAPGGALAVPPRVAPRVVEPEKAFLDPTFQQVRVAGKGFLGRRRQVQELLRWLRAGRAVLVHGPGRQGKSSLAERIARRLRWPLAVVFQHYDARSVVDAIGRSLGEAAWARGARERVSAEPRALEEALQELSGRREFLLVVDDLERVLDPGPGPRAIVRAAAVEPLRAIVRALAWGEGLGRLLVTSRFDFRLPDEDDRDLTERVERLPLPGFSAAEARRRAARARVPQERVEAIREAAKANPGLLDLLLRLAEADPGAVDALLGEVERWEREQVKPTTGELLAFVEQLGLEALLRHLEREMPLLRASQLFWGAVPESVMAALAEAVGVPAGAVARLVALGAWERQPDPGGTGGAWRVSELVAARLEGLSEAEERGLAPIAIAALERAWPTEGLRPYAAVELALLALRVGEEGVIARCGEDAVAVLEELGELPAATAVARATLSALERRGVEAGAGLLLRGARLVAQAGEPAEAERWVEAALARPDPVGETERMWRAEALRQRAARRRQLGDPAAALADLEAAREVLPAGSERERAVMLGDIARIRADKGEVDEALGLHEQALAVYTALGDKRSAAVTLGDIARIRADKGEVDEALGLHEQRLAIMTALGDKRSTALTLGDIAQIRAGNGEVDEAVRLLDQVLGLATKLGDVDGIAGAQWDLAQLELRRGRVDQARPRLDQAWSLLLRIGRVDALAAVGSTYGRILLAADERDRAREVLTLAARCWRKLGQESNARALEALLESASKPDPIRDAIRLFQHGKPAEALTQLASLATEAESAGDLGRTATVMAVLAQIQVAVGDRDAGLRSLARAIQLATEFGDAEMVQQLGQLRDQLQGPGTGGDR